MAESRVEPAEQIRAAREEAGLTQRQTAELLKVDVQTVSRWERGERGLKPHVLEAILTKLQEAARAAVGTAHAEVAQRHDAPSELPLTPAERGWLFHFAGELAEIGATDQEIAEARALIASDVARAFYRGDVTKMRALADTLRAELERRHRRKHPAHLLPTEAEEPLEHPRSRRPSRRGGSA